VRQQAVDCDNPYAYSGAGKKIAETLSEIEINEKLLQKKSEFDV
jgi:hypothetical protein